MLLSRMLSDQTQHQVERCRILDKGEIDGFIARLDFLKPPKSRSDMAQGRLHLIQSETGCQSRPDCRRCIIDVMQPWKRYFQLDLALRSAQSHMSRASAIRGELH